MVESAFLNADGSEINYITKARLGQIVLDIYQKNLSETASEIDKLRTRIDICVNWISALQQYHNEQDLSLREDPTLQQDNSLSIAFRQGIDLVVRLLEKWESFYSSLALESGTMTQMLVKDSSSLREMGLGYLASFAYSPEGKDSLYMQLAAYDRFVSLSNFVLSSLSELDQRNVNLFLKQLTERLNAKTGLSLEQALIDFNEHSIYTRSFELRKLVSEVREAIKPSQVQKDIDIASVIIKPLVDILENEYTSKKERKTRLEIARDLKYLIDSINPFIESTQTIPEDYLLTALDGFIRKEEAQNKLWEEMKKHKEFMFFDSKNVWSLVVDGLLRVKKGQYGLEDESGFMGGIMDAFRLMLEKRREGIKLSADVLLEMHDVAVKNVLERGMTWRKIKYLPNDDPARYSAILPPGYRPTNQPNSFGLVFETNNNKDSFNTTPAGFKELYVRSKNEPF